MVEKKNTKIQIFDTFVCLVNTVLLGLILNINCITKKVFCLFFYNNFKNFNLNNLFIFLYFFNLIELAMFLFFSNFDFFKRLIAFC